MLHGKTLAGQVFPIALLTSLNIFSFSGNLVLLSLTGEDYLLMNGEIGDREEYGAFTRFVQTMIMRRNFLSNYPPESSNFLLIRVILYWIVLLEVVQQQ